MLNLFSPLIENNIPSFIRKEYPLATSLIVDYYKWLEQDDNLIDLLFNFNSNLEINDKNSKYIDDILSDLGWDTIKTVDFDKRLLINTLKDFYMSRGSTNSLKYLFKVLFNSDVDISYPREKMFVLSNTEYYFDTKMLISTLNFDKREFQQLLTDFSFTAYITGVISNSKALIHNIELIEKNNIKYIQLSINKPTKQFVNEQIKITYKNKDFIENIYERPNITIRNPGLFYKKGDEVVLTGFSVQGKILIDQISSGSISGTTILNGGTNYQVGDRIIAEPTLKGLGFLGRVDKVDVNGVITRIVVWNTGDGYIELPQLIVVSATGTGALIQAESKNIGKIISFKHVDLYWDKISGINYTIITNTGQSAVLKIDVKKFSNDSIKQYRNDNHILGNNCVITDSNKYNEFSYLIRSNIPFSSTRKYIYEYSHPAGVNIFSIFDKTNNTVLTNSLLTSSTNSISKVIILPMDAFHGSHAYFNTLFIKSFTGDFRFYGGTSSIISLGATYQLQTDMYSGDEFIITDLIRTIMFDGNFDVFVSEQIVVDLQANIQMYSSGSMGSDTLNDISVSYIPEFGTITYQGQVGTIE